MDWQTPLLQGFTYLSDPQPRQISPPVCDLQLWVKFAILGVSFLCVHLDLLSSNSFKSQRFRPFHLTSVDPIHSTSLTSLQNEIPSVHCSLRTSCSNRSCNSWNFFLPCFLLNVYSPPIWRCTLVMEQVYVLSCAAESSWWLNRSHNLISPAVCYLLHCSAPACSS